MYRCGGIPTVSTKPTKSVEKRDEKKMALLPEMTKENKSFAIVCVLSDNYRFQSEYNIEPTAKPIKIVL